MDKKREEEGKIATPTVNRTTKLILQLKNEWSYTSSYFLFFHCVDRDNFNFALLPNMIGIFH
jgi:hypothetical protein